MDLELKNQENIYISNTKDKGKTYFAKKDFKKGEIVMYLCGPIVFEPSDYTCPIGFGVFIDPTDLGGMYLNDYGVNANLGIKQRTELVAIRDIKKDEEIGIAYFMFVPRYITNSTAYKLNLSTFSNLSKENKEKFREYTSDYLFNDNEVKMYEKFFK